MLIACKTTGCAGHVDYEPEVVPLALFDVALKTTGSDLLSYIPADKFDKAVTHIVTTATNPFNRMKTVYLTCDNTVTPHTNAYQVPAK